MYIYISDKETFPPNSSFLARTRIELESIQLLYYLMNVGNSEMKYAMGCRDAYSSIFPILLSIELDGSIRRLEKRKEIQVFPVCQTLYVASVTLITVSSKLTSTSNQSHKTVLMTVHDAAGLHKIKVFESGNASFK